MEMSEALSQQERLQAIAEKRKRQTEIENKRRQLEDDRRQLQHLKSKALRERWLLDGVPSGGPEEDEAKKQLQEDEAKTRGLEEAISRLEQELVELETGVSATSTKENLSDAAKEEIITADSQVPAASVKVVHEMREVDGVVVTNGVQQLSSSEVEELILKADEAILSEGGAPQPALAPAPDEEARSSPMKEITGMEAMPGGGGPEAFDTGDASTENPVTMVFMGYQSVEDEAETKKVLGLEGTVKAELVVIEDAAAAAANVTTTTDPSPTTPAAAAEQTKETAQEQQAPPNGSTAEPIKTPDETEGADKGGAEATGAELNNKEKQPCKCCVIM